MGKRKIYSIGKLPILMSTLYFYVAKLTACEIGTLVTLSPSSHNGAFRFTIFIQEHIDDLDFNVGDILDVRNDTGEVRVCKASSDHSYISSPKGIVALVHTNVPSTIVSIEEYIAVNALGDQLLAYVLGINLKLGKFKVKTFKSNTYNIYEISDSSFHLAV